MRLVAASLVILLGSSATLLWAQRSDPLQKCDQTIATIQVRVTDDHDRPISQQVKVELLDSTGVTIDQRFTSNDGLTRFTVAGMASYHAKVTGMGMQEALSDSIDLSCGQRSAMAYVRVKPLADALTPKPQVQSGITSAADLKVPGEARKQFEKGVAAWEAHDYSKAALAYLQATVLYPQYDAAFNNLGAAYMKLGEMEKARSAFETAVRLNDKNATAERNLSRLLIRKGSYAEAESLLKRSFMVEPQDPGGLTLMAVAEMQLGEYDAALREAQRVHSVPHEEYAVSHYIAGQILERQRKADAAVEEYQLYLQESPNGEEVALVRTALARIDEAKVQEQ